MRRIDKTRRADSDSYTLCKSSCHCHHQFATKSSGIQYVAGSSKCPYSHKHNGLAVAGPEDPMAHLEADTRACSVTLTVAYRLGMSVIPLGSRPTLVDITWVSTAAIPIAASTLPGFRIRRLTLGQVIRA